MDEIMLQSHRERYVVPFSYKNKDVSYEAIIRELNNNEEWNPANLRAGEQDIYDYILDGFVEKESKSNIASAWNYERKDKKGRILQLAWLIPKKEKAVLVEIRQAGLFLFRSGIGLFWYEPVFPKIQPTLDELVLFQNRFKELNRGDNVLSFYQIVDDSMRVDVEEGQTTLEQNPEGIDLCVNFSLIGRASNRQLKFWACRKFAMGNWIAGLLGGLPCPVQFYPERKNCYPNAIHEPAEAYSAVVPDKAVLFNYVVMSEQETSKEDLLHVAFYLTNGYKKSYMMAEDMECQMYKPFDNAYWNVTRGGCGYYIRSREENQAFYTGDMQNKVIHDYFLLYILLLYQSYTLLYYSEKLQAVLSADTKAYLEDIAYTEILEKISTEINVFLVKSVYASVSHIHHQNGFYEYAENVLGIKADIKSITIGLDSLEELQKMKLHEQEALEEKAVEEKRQQRDNRMNLGLGALSFFAIFSAFVDGYELCQKIVAVFGLKGTYAHILYGGMIFLVALVSFYAVGNFWISYIENRKDR